MHNLITQHHRIVLQGRTEGKESWLETADFVEVDDSSEDLQELVRKLNEQQQAKPGNDTWVGKRVIPGGGR